MISLFTSLVPFMVGGGEERGLTRDGMGWDGMGWDGMGWEGRGWEGRGGEGRGGEGRGGGKVISNHINEIKWNF